MYMCVFVFSIPINEDEAMNLKESRENIWEGFKGGNWKGKYYSYSNLKIKNKSLKKEKDRSVHPHQFQWRDFHR